MVLLCWSAWCDSSSIFRCACPEMQQQTRAYRKVCNIVVMFDIRTFTASLLLSDRLMLITLLAASLVLEYHMRPPSERFTMVAFNVISST